MDSGSTEDPSGPPNLAGVVPTHSRRVALKRLGVALGVVVVGGGAVAVTEGDDGVDAARPLFTELLRKAPQSDGPTIAFLPGLGATTRFWKTRVTALTAQARILLVDLLGFGRSPKPWTEYTVDRHVTALRQVLQPVAATGPLVLVGHSLGARLAVTYAARYPDDVAQLVLVSMPYFGGTERAKGYFGRRGAEGWIMTHMIPAAIACLVSRRLLGWMLPTLLPDVPREVAEDLNQMTWRSSTSTLWEVIYDYDLTSDLASVEGRIPMLCLHGDLDRSAPLGPIRELASSHRDCALRVYVGATHGLPLEQPEWVRAQIASVLPA